MSVDVFGDRVHDDISSVIEGVLDIGAKEGVVDDDFDVEFMGDVGDCLDVYQSEGGVTGGLDPDQLCRWMGLKELTEVDFNGAGEGDGDTVGGRYLGEVTVGASV